jgi:hypothetical protein
VAHPLFEFRAPSERSPAKPSRWTLAPQLLSWAYVPFGTCRNRRSTCLRRCLPKAFRLQGLPTLLTVFAPRFRAGSVSHRLRPWDSPFGASPSDEASATFPPGQTHLPFLLPVIPIRKGLAGPGRPRFLGFSPIRSPWRLNVGLAREPLDAPLGFSPRRYDDGDLERDFARSPLACLLVRQITPAEGGISEFRSVSDALRRTMGQALSTGPEQPVWGFRASTLLPCRSAPLWL